MLSHGHTHPSVTQTQCHTSHTHAHTYMQSHTRSHTNKLHTYTETHTHTASPPWAAPPGSRGLNLYLYCPSPPWGPTDPSLKHFLALLGPSPTGGQALPPGRALVQSLGCCEVVKGSRAQTKPGAPPGSVLWTRAQVAHLSSQPCCLQPLGLSEPTPPHPHTFSCRCVLSSHQNRNKLPTF